MSEPDAAAPITLDQLRVFLAVVEAGSFTGAAHQLRRVQSAISYSIANLERLLEVELFDRSRRRPALTPVGRRLVSHARTVCNAADTLRSTTHPEPSDPEPALRVAVDPLVPTSSLCVALVSFAARFPRAAVHLRAPPGADVHRAVAEGRCTFGLSASVSEPTPGLEVGAIGRLVHHVVCGAQHPLAHREFVTPEDLAAARELRLASPSDGKYGPEVSPPWTIGDLVQLSALLRAGIGWARLPEHTLRNHLEANAWTTVTVVGEPPASSTVGLLFRAGETLSEPAMRLAETVRASFES